MVLVPGLSWEYGTSPKEIRRSWDGKNMLINTASLPEHPSTVGPGPPSSIVTTAKRNCYKMKHSQSGREMARVDLYCSCAVRKEATVAALS